MPSHMRSLPYFKSHPCPEDWSIHEYLSFRHRPIIKPRRILDGWKKSLRVIANCTSPSCCTPEQRLRAHDLIARYNQKGKGSDRQYGQSWLAQKTTKESQPAPPVKIGAVYQGAVYQGDVMNAPFTQTNHNHRSPQQTVPGGNQDYDEDSDSGSEIYQPEDTTTESLADNTNEDLSAAPTENTSEELSVAQASFTGTYNSMDKNCQWVLGSGRTVESVIFHACQDMDADTFANTFLQSFVLDISDPNAQNLFTREEWDEIKSHVLPLPKPDVVLVESLRRFFSVKTTDELRDVLQKTSYLPDGVAYDPNIHSNSQWADMVMRMLLMLFMAPGEPLRASHLEDWYTSYLWSPILDYCLLDLPGMTVERKEAPCRATSVRKNRHRTKTGPGNRLKTGRRLDAIIHTVEDDYFEYGGMEVSRTFNGVTSSKWLGDSFKLVKALRDMLFRLHELVDHDEAIAKKLQVVGVFNGGLSFQLIRMSHPKGYVCLLQREKMKQVPTSVQDLMKLLKVLMDVASMKQIIKDCVAAVDGRHACKTEAEIFKELVEGTVGDQARLGWAADTP